MEEVPTRLRCNNCDSTLSVRWPQVDLRPMNYVHRYHSAWISGAKSGCSLCTVIASVVKSTAWNEEQTSDGTEPSIFAIFIAKGDKFVLELRRSTDTKGGKILIYTQGCDGFDSHIQSFNPIPVSSASNESFIRARSWFLKCKQVHKACNQEPPFFLPTRLLHIESERVRIRVGLLKAVPYIALSHCWGNGQTLKTTRSNMEQLQTFGLDLNLLPRTFRDAVRIAEKLGFDYIWIDSLCIIQDSEDDWMKQSRAMAYVYGGADLVLGATTASSTDEGFLRDRECIPEGQVTVQIAGRTENSTVRYRNIKSSGTKGPLENRAWAFQEKMMARRYLGYGSREMVWDCGECSECECDCVANPSNIYNKNEVTHVQTLIRAMPEAFDSQATQIYGQYWRDCVVEQYSKRQLTIPTDALVALSAIATAIKKRTGWNYLAGCWEETLRRDLLWTARDSEVISNETILVSKRTRNQHSNLHVPTWSWASVRGKGVAYSDAMSDLDPSMDSYDLGIDFRRDPRNEFGSVYQGILKIKERSFQASLAYQSPTSYTLSIPEDIKGFRLVSARFDTPLIPQEMISSDGARETIIRRAPYGNRFQESPAKSKCIVYLLILGSMKQNYTASVLEALVLSPSLPNPGYYERIGWCQLIYDIEGLQWPSQTLNIINKVSLTSFDIISNAQIVLEI